MMSFFRKRSLMIPRIDWTWRNLKLIYWGLETSGFQNQTSSRLDDRFSTRPQKFIYSAMWKSHLVKNIALIKVKNDTNTFNSQAVGWNSCVPSALKSIFGRFLIFWSAAWFFVIILKFIFTPIFQIKTISWIRTFFVYEIWIRRGIKKQVFFK